MVTPLANTTRKPGSNYPLFVSLLREAHMRDSNSAALKCPQTAPVLTTGTSHTNVSKAGSGNMDTGSSHMNSISENIEDTPISLQDPPKSKLKRQLSIETSEKTEAGRITKRHCYPGQKTGTGSNFLSDEVDGFTNILKQSSKSDENYVSAVTLADEAIKSSIHPLSNDQHRRTNLVENQVNESAGLKLAASDSRQCEVSSAQTRPYCYQTDKQSNVFSQIRSDGQVQGSAFQSYNSGYREYKGHDEFKQNLVSPVPFNLHDISQTSPFISTTPTLQKSKENTIFIFPEQTTPKKVSPYAPLTEQPETSSPLQHANTPSRYSHIYSTYENERSGEFVSRQTQQRNNEPDDVQHGVNLPPHVSPKGFIWPKTPNLTRYPTYSPKAGSSESKQTLPVYTEPKSRAINRYDGCEDDYAKLCMLKREYTRAMQNYGFNAREPGACRPRGVNDVIRQERFKSQRSAEERSPNEKAIHEIQEEVHNRFERSFSDPLYNPLHHRHLLRHASRLARERIMELETDRSQEALHTDLKRESWQQDYRVRLFMKGDPYTQRLLDRQRSSIDIDSTYAGGTEIPHEVLEFLHSLNFHPEELENLKDYLRRGGTENHNFCRASNQGHLDGQVDFLQPPEAETQKRSPNSKGGLDMRHRQREHQMGDINLRVSCGGFQENGERQPEVDNDVRDCKCVRIENEIRSMAMGAYSKIRGMDEFHETNSNVFDSMNVLRQIKTLCNHGRTIQDIYTGSVVFTINCPDIDALLDLWNMYKSGAILKLMRAAFVTDEVKKKFDCTDFDLKCYISKEEYMTCKYELEASFQKKFLGSGQSSPNIVHTRSRSEPASMTKQVNILSPARAAMSPARAAMSPFRERFCSDSSIELSPRMVFQEINTRDIPRDTPRDNLLPPFPSSPSKKFVSDNVFYSGEDSPRSPLAPISPLTSPRRKSFGTKFQFTEHQQQENVEKASETKPTTSGTLV